MATIHGTNGNDKLSGTTSNDEIFGYKGADIIFGSLGADRIDGGQDDPTLADRFGDTVDYSKSHGPLQINLQQIVQHGGHAEGDQLYFIENVIGSIYNDEMRASASTNLLEGGRGADTIYGWLGHGMASYAGSRAPVQIDLNVTTQHGGDAEGDQLYDISDVLGSAYDDTIIGNWAANDLFGSAGNDTFQGGTSNDHIVGGEGRDTIRLDTYGGSTSVFVALADGEALGYASYSSTGEQDTLVSIENAIGTKYRDEMYGNSADNEFQGLGSGDDIHGGGGSDTLWGGSGGDTLSGDAGRDRLFGENDDDILTGGGEADELDGGDGYDTATYESSTSGVTVSLLPGQVGSGGDAQGDTLVRIEHLTGSAFSDSLTGDAGFNILKGGDGNDTLSGGDGRDVLIGGKGDDTLSGGSDGARDTFVIEFTAEGGQLHIGNDTITDWQSFDSLEFRYGPSDIEVNATQVGDDVVLTIVGVAGSITLLDTLL
jgi:Ca2+-binding RTX toxin-like protein